MIKLTRPIILDNCEYLPAGTVLYNYGEHSLYSVVPSRLKDFPSKTRGKIDKDCIIDFCRIPRNCIDIDNLSGKLKKALIKGDDTISPFHCTIIGKRLTEERHILESPHLRLWHEGDFRYYDSKLNPINVIIISSISELSIGAHHQFCHLPQVENEYSASDTFVTFYYSGSANLKVKKITSNKFYADFQAYHTVVEFSELPIEETVVCYSLIDNHVHFEFIAQIIDIGRGNAWLERFQKAHSSIELPEVAFKEEDIHIFARLSYYDKETRNNVSELRMLHQSSCKFIFARQRTILKTRIKEFIKL